MLSRTLVLLASLTLLGACPDDPDPGEPGSDVVDIDATPDVAPDAADMEVADADPDAADVDPGPVDLTAVLEPGQVRAGVVDDTAALLTGPKADGRLGDAKIYNSHVAFIVESARIASGGYRRNGGNIVDLAAIGPDGVAAEDHFGELFMSWNLYTFEPDTMEIVSDGRDGEAHVRLTGKAVPFYMAIAFLAPLLPSQPPVLDVVYDYTLRPDDLAVRLDVTLTNTDTVTLPIEWDVTMANQGDSARNWVPPYGFDNEAAGGTVLDVYRVAGQDVGYGWMVEPADLQLLYSYVGVDIFLRDTWELAPGQSSTRTSWFTAASGGPAGLEATLRAIAEPETPVGTVSGTVTLPEGADAEKSRVAAYDEGMLVTMAPVEADGSYAMELLPGSYELVARAHGFRESAPAQATVSEGAEATADLAVPANATVTVKIADGDGAPVDGRVTFLRQGETPSVWADDDVRLEEDWGGSINAIAFHLSADTVVAVPPGEYRAVATHGFAWETDEQIVTVAEGEAKTLEFTLTKAVDTTGWISADFHVHAVRSPDSAVPYDIRALQGATDGLDMPLLTEHVQIGRFGDTLDDTGVGARIIDMASQEVTTFAFGHFNAFPLVEQPLEFNRGAVFAHGKTPEELFQSIRDHLPSDVIIQVNHPRNSAKPGAYFGYVGLDENAEPVEEPDGWSTNWDTIEVFNGSCSRGGENGEALQDWIHLTNKGYTKALSSGSDTHSMRKAPGSPRNYIALTAGAVRSDAQAFVDAVRGRQMFVSCGPFVRFQASDGTGIGGRTSIDAGTGEVSFDIQVEAPTWMTISTVNVYENGVVIDAIDVSAPADPVLRLDTTVTYTPSADAWYFVEVVGSGSNEPAASSSPFAMTNPIEVEVDGDGEWTAPGLQ